jgi:hypothetical protein
VPGWPADEQRAAACIYDGWRVSASRSVRVQDRESIACQEGSTIAFTGFTDIALIQIGDSTRVRFLDEAAAPLLAKLRAAAHAG